MLKENQILMGIISSIDEDGNGIIQQGKDRVFVRQVMMQERVKVKIKRRLQKGYSAEVVEILQADKQRMKPQCPIYQKCGSCHLMHITQEGQAQYKTNRIKAMCKKNKLPLQVEVIKNMKEPYHYRNKMIIGFTKDRTRHIHAGFYEEFSHQIIPYQSCLLHPSLCDDIIQYIVTLMEKFKVEPYEEDKRRGLLRHVVLRYGEISKQIMVILVINQTVFPARKAFVEQLTSKFPEITTIIQNVNTRKTSVVLGDAERVLYGKGYIEDELCGLTYRISPSSFYQINHQQTEVLYQTAIDLLELKGFEKVLDTYCGIGTIGMSVAHKVKEVIGVEINANAVKDAINNARINKIRNIKFLCEDASIFMKKASLKRQHYDVVIMDPPRNGSSEDFISSLVSMKPKQVLYISCNPLTQMRDLLSFKRRGYEADRIIPVDMFPFTNHVESIVRLSRSK